MPLRNGELKRGGNVLVESRGKRVPERLQNPVWFSAIRVQKNDQFVRWHGSFKPGRIYQSVRHLNIESFVSRRNEDALDKYSFSAEVSGQVRKCAAFGLARGNDDDSFCHPRYVPNPVVS